jgi:hypothetical protein
MLKHANENALNKKKFYGNDCSANYNKGRNKVKSGSDDLNE